jgi:4-amino-4-deoxy-L-arabinose transferase-like glycosyltransferase
VVQCTHGNRDLAASPLCAENDLAPVFHLTHPTAPPVPSVGRRELGDLAACLAIIIVALVIGCAGVGHSGTLWADGPQYANAGAMIRDWVRSGQLLHPFDFARANYAQYPAFSVPYHPPGYPALLGAFFLLAGVSYESARVFIALSLAIAGGAFYGILRRSDVERVPALICALLLMTMPVVAKWSRDTMSEIPALAFVLVATYWVSRWLDSDRYLDAALAFAFAALAFFSKINVVGVLVAWPIWIVVRGQWRRMFSPSLVIPAAVFVALVAAWVKFFIPYARYETQMGLSTAEISALQPRANVWMYLRGLPGMTGWSVLIVSIVGLVVALRSSDGRRSAAVWGAWFIGYAVFLVLIPLHYEPRYFTFAMPTLPAFVALFFLPRASTSRVRVGGYALAGVVFVENVAHLRQLEPGVVGLEQLARRLAVLPESGNVLVSVPFQNDLMFRYRAASPGSDRQFIRGDRSIVIRLDAYAPVANHVRTLVSAPDSFVALIRRGRVRYLVTLPPTYSRDWNGEPAGEMRIAAHTTAAIPDEFAPVDSFRVHFGELGPEPDMWIHLWAYRHPLPPGPSEIPITIPTAKLTYPPGK